MGMGGGMYGGGMYGGGMHGAGMLGQQQNQQQVDPNDPEFIEQQRQQQQREEFRQNLQGTIMGMNASIGMAYGMTQVGYIGSQVLKYTYYAVKYVLKKIFRLSNITKPLKFIMKLLLGTDFESRSQKLRHISPESMKVLESAWVITEASKSQAPLPQPPNMIRRMMNLFKNLMVVVVGLSAGLVLYLMRQHKNNELEQKEIRERQKLQENLQKMKAMWEQHQKRKIQPQLTITAPGDSVKQLTQSKRGADEAIIEVDENSNTSDLQELEASAYEISSSDHAEQGNAILEGDLDINEMNFNLIKISDALKPVRNLKQFEMQGFDEVIETNRVE